MRALGQDEAAECDIAKAKQIEPGIGLEPMVLTSPAAAKIMVIELAVMR